MITSGGEPVTIDVVDRVFGTAHTTMDDLREQEIVPAFVGEDAVSNETIEAFIAYLRSSNQIAYYPGHGFVLLPDAEAFWQEFERFDSERS